MLPDVLNKLHVSGIYEKTCIGAVEEPNIYYKINKNSNLTYVVLSEINY